jgi:tRNA G18 (ribose-2'-O)-methylase SpoU
MRVKKITELNRISIEEFKEVKKIPLTIILDNIRSLNNIGSIFRTSDAFLVENIILCGITATPPHPDIHKTALGAEYSVDWSYYENTSDAILKLKKDGYTICALEQATESIMLNNMTFDESIKYALILGNEVKGVTQDIVNMCDMCIEIPQHGTKHSLNVAIAAGIVIWNFFEKLK